MLAQVSMWPSYETIGLLISMVAVIYGNFKWFLGRLDKHEAKRDLWAQQMMNNILDITKLNERLVAQGEFHKERLDIHDRKIEKLEEKKR
jgi:hypothetical protein